MGQRLVQHLAGKHAFQSLTYILPADDAPESIEVVDVFDFGI
jgi:hypothetical protein